MLRKTILVIFIYLFATIAIVNAEDLRFGILPVTDTLPLQVAVKEGYFKEQNLNIRMDAWGKLDFDQMFVGVILNEGTNLLERLISPWFYQKGR